MERANAQQPNKNKKEFYLNEFDPQCQFKLIKCPDPSAQNLSFCCEMSEKLNKNGIQMQRRVSLAKRLFCFFDFCN